MSSIVRRSAGLSLRRCRHHATLCGSATAFDLSRCRTEIAERHAREQPDGQAREWEDPRSAWHWLDRELSSNLAGETGAVAIYDGAAAGLRVRCMLVGNRAVDASTLEFINAHREAEAGHLALFEALLPEGKRTNLLPIWRASGFALGFMPALISPRALFVTVEAVEAFVEEHYQAQIQPLRDEGLAPELVQLLTRCCEDEVHHKHDAAKRAAAERRGSASTTLDSSTVAERCWATIVRRGSAIAAECARRV